MRMRFDRKLRRRPVKRSVCAGLFILTAFIAAAQNPTLKTRTKEERDRQYALQAERVPTFGEYQQKTDRVIPVVALTRS